MQISRRFLFACAVIAILLPKLNAADTEAQRKAREALNQKIQQLEGGGPAPAATPSAAPAIAPKVQPAPAPVRPASTGATAPASSVSKANQEKALQALREAMKSGGATVETTSSPASQPQPKAVTQPAQVQAPITSVTAAPSAAPAASAENHEKALQALREAMKAPSTTVDSAQAAGEGQFQPLPETTTADNEKLIQALREKNKQLDQAQTVPEPKPATVVKESPKAKPEEKPAVAAKPKTESKPEPTIRASRKGLPAWTPIQGPASGLAPEKEERLRMLLDDYKADKLTPAQYHAERAKILAEP